MIEERLDRQTRIEGWDQEALDRRIMVLGDDDSLASHYILSAAALGIGEIVAVAPSLDERLIQTAHGVNPNLNLAHIEGHYTHEGLDALIGGSDPIIDCSHTALVKKLAINHGFRRCTPVLSALVDDGGFRMFPYQRGREVEDLLEVIPEHQLPREHTDDPVLSSIVSAMLLEESTGYMMTGETTSDIVRFDRTGSGTRKDTGKALVVGAGALGNFVALGLAYSRATDVTIMDPDVVEETNLNRQVFLYDGVGKPKAETLARRMGDLFNVTYTPQVRYFTQDIDVSGYDIVFDCVDNFETRIALSESCYKSEIHLISGGTNVHAGQMVFWVPGKGMDTPAHQLGLYELVEERGSAPRERTACTYRPDPSVIMTNQIIAGFMVDAYNHLREGTMPRSIFYESKGHRF